jgi:hypothetical protein
MWRSSSGLALGLVVIVALSSSSHGQSQITSYVGGVEDLMCDECLSGDDCNAEQFYCSANYEVTATQRCPTAPYDRVYETTWLNADGTGTCGGSHPSCGFYPQCDPTFVTNDYTDGCPSPFCHHVFQVTRTSKTLDYAGGFFSCRDDGTQVYEVTLSLRFEGEPPCDQP